MRTEISIILKPGEEEKESLIFTKILRALNEKNISFDKTKLSSTLLKKSVDARHGKVKYFLKYAVTDEGSQEFSIPQWKDVSKSKKSVVVVGSGPAGLFAALKLLEKGIKPVIVERGAPVDLRRRDIAAISTKGFVDSNSNYCFGEGGAGTFSDGKLFTRSNKRGDISSILKIFNHFGADEKIITDAHPHIGTDKLPAIISAMREKIISLGGEYHFNALVTDLIIEDKCVKGVKIKNLLKNNQNTKIESDATDASFDFSASDEPKDEEKILADGVILATGHSATDVYKMLAKIAPSALEAKTFAVGVRIEHPRTVIDGIQDRRHALKTASEYRLTTQVENRGVYSFCMCPGGFVVPSSTENEGIVVNGMSAAKRNSLWSNSAIVVETRPEDIPVQFQERAKKAGCEALAGLYFRQHIEELTKKEAVKASGNEKSQQAPAQRVTDFLDGYETKDFPKTSFTPGIVSSRLDKWLPPQIGKRLAQGLRNFNADKMRGFINRDAILIASETRTSTPVRILRNKDTYECTVLKNLYPCGEGSGYSGGIVSSAMDGENAADILSESLLYFAED